MARYLQQVSLASSLVQFSRKVNDLQHRTERVVVSFFEKGGSSVEGFFPPLHINSRPYLHILSAAVKVKLERQGQNKNLPAVYKLLSVQG